MTSTAAPKNAYSALRAAGHDIGKRDILLVPPSALTLIVDPKHPLYDSSVDLEVPESFLEDIAVRGVMNAVIAKRDGERLLVVAGRQRTKAAKILADRGIEIRVPVMIRAGGDKDLVLAALSENAHRVNNSPMSAASKALIAQTLGASLEEIGKALGCRPATVEDLLTLVSMPAPVQAAVESGVAPKTMIRSLAALGSEKATKAVGEMAKLSDARAAQGHSPKLQYAEAASAVQATKEGKDVNPAELPTRRTMRRRTELQAVYEGLKAAGPDYAIAASVVAWVMGHDHALQQHKGLTAVVKKAIGSDD